MDHKYFAVMLIDDNEIDNIINSKIIESSSLAKHIYTQTGALSAIDFLKNANKLFLDNIDIVPEYIFLDIDMPMMDGFQFLEEFSKLPQAVIDKSKVIMLTASVNPKDKDIANSFRGMVKYINKPLSVDHLASL